MTLLQILLRLLLVMAVLVPGVSFASVTKGEIKGTTVDEGGLPVPGVVVTITSSNLMGMRQAQTDGEGRFRFIELPPGQYQVIAEASGFQTKKVEGVGVVVGRTAILTIEMKLSSGGNEIVIEERRPVVDTESANRGSVLSKEFLERIPAGRSYQSAVQLAAGTTGGANANIAGAASNENTYLLDGVNITDPVTGTFSMNFNFDAIEQLEVLTSAYDPEYGVNLGGSINIVTETGGNNLEVKTGLYVWNGNWSPKIDERWAADGTPLAPTDFDSTFEIYQVGMKVSGPIIRDKAWFIASYQLARSLLANSGVITPRDFDGHYMLAKITVQPNSSHRITLLGQTDPSTIDNIYTGNRFILPEAQGRQAQGGFAASLQWDWFISPTNFLETKTVVQKTFIERYGVPCTHNQDIGYNPCGPTELENAIDLQTPGRSGVNNALDRGNNLIFDFDDRWRVELQSKYSLLQVEALGTHDIKAGFDTSLLIWDKTFGISGNHYYVDWNQLAYNPNTYQNYYWVEYSQPYNYTTYSQTFGVFIQDVYKPIDNLTFRYGTRYDRQVFRNDVGEAIINTGLWGPRFSAIWDPWGDAKTKLSGSIGRFNDTARIGLADYLSESDFGTKLFLGEPFNGFTADANNNYSYAPITNTNSVLPGLTAPRADMFSVGAQREIVQDLALSLDFTGKFTRNLYVFDELNYIWDQNGYNIIGTSDGTINQYYRLRTPTIGRREYYRTDVILNKVFSDRWEMQGSYSYSVSKGSVQTTPSGFLAVPTQAEFYVDGNLPTDIRHSVKAGGVWELPTDPWTTEIGGTLFMESGYPITRGYDNGFNGSLLIDTVGTYARVEPWWELNILIRQAIPVKKGALKGQIQFLNITNNRQANNDSLSYAGVSFDNRWIIVQRQTPLQLMVGAEYEF